jgi:hypothetical protein
VFEFGCDRSSRCSDFGVNTVFHADILKKMRPRRAGPLIYFSIETTSTSKTRLEFGGMAPPAPRAP